MTRYRLVLILSFLFFLTDFVSLFPPTFSARTTTRKYSKIKLDKKCRLHVSCQRRILWSFFFITRSPAPSTCCCCCCCYQGFRKAELTALSLFVLSLEDTSFRIARNGYSTTQHQIVNTPARTQQ